MADPSPKPLLDPETLAILRCPVTGSALRLKTDCLVSEVGGLRYRIRDGIPVLLAEEAILPAGCPSLAAFKEQFRDQISRRD